MSRIDEKAEENKQNFFKDAETDFLSHDDPRNFEDEEENIHENIKKSSLENKENKDLLPQLPEKFIEKKYHEYILKRQNFILEMQSTKYNGINFSQQEERANKIFKKLVKNLKGQLSDSFYKEFTMKHKEFIEKTNIYKILKKMPKGANLHLHVDTAFDLDWVNFFSTFFNGFNN